MPISLLSGKPQPEKTVVIIHKMWHVIMEGIGSLKFKNDPNILRNLTNLIVKWTPHFKIVSLIQLTKFSCNFFFFSFFSGIIQKWLLDHLLNVLATTI